MDENRPNTKRIGELLARVIDLGKYQVCVGVPSSKASRTDDESPLNNAQIAAINEFGSADGRIPERSFLRAGLVENRNKHARLLGQAARRVSEGRETPMVALGRVGTLAAADIKHKIATGPFVENADSTKKKKAREHPGETIKPLIDHGQLVQSIDHVIKKGGSE